jgi:hypothetical protein
MSNTADKDAIRACIARCAALPNENGRWQAEARCIAALRDIGTTPAIGDACAAAARRLGAWLAGVAPC